MDDHVIDLAAAREARAQRERDEQFEVMEASDHPVLRWVAGSAFYIAHRKDGPGAACGARGSLVLAPPGVPLCVQCYPHLLDPSKDQREAT